MDGVAGADGVATPRFGVPAGREAFMFTVWSTGTPALETTFPRACGFKYSINEWSLRETISASTRVLCQSFAFMAARFGSVLRSVVK